MMRYLYVLALILITGLYTFSSGAGVAGNDDDDDDDSGNSSTNYLEVEAQSSLDFKIDNPNDFEQEQVQNNAVRISLMSKSSDCSIYAKISSYTTPYGADRSNIPLELQYRSDNSNKTSSLVTGPIQLTNYDKRLFINKKDKKEYRFHYDMRLQPLGYDYPEGQYKFTVLFTMTQP